MLKIVTLVVVIIGMAFGYIYARLHNNIDNILEAHSSWRSEVLEFPLIFANDLDYQGEEHIRFAPGWGEPDSEDYFSYIFVWMIEEKPDLNSSKLEHLMNVYFDGLMNTGAITNFRFFKDIPKTKSSFKELEHNTFEGSIELYDEFFKKEVILLNAKIKSGYCPLRKKQLIWFYLSPQESNHQIWDKLMEVKSNIRCR